MVLTNILIIAIIGIILSIYALYVEYKKSKNKNYQAACDISDNSSCTKAFLSSYGKILGIPNSALGIIFYLIIIILSLFNTYNNIIFYLSVISFIGSLYLAYILYFKLKNFCLVCNAIYVVNILLLIFSYLRF